MDITDAKEERLRLGVDRFLAGNSVEYHGVTFYLAKGATLQIDCYTEWEPERTSEEHAKEQLTRSKAVFADLCSKSAQFNAAAGRLHKEFSLCHNYGMGSIALARETNGQFQWLVSRNEA